MRGKRKDEADALTRPSARNCTVAHRQAPELATARPRRGQSTRAPLPPPGPSATIAAEQRGGFAGFLLRPDPASNDADQVAVGSLSAVLAALFAMGLRKPPAAQAQADAIMAGVGAAAWALWKTSGQRWLLVTGTRVPGRDGYATKVRRIEAETFDEAREAMAAAIGAAKQTKAVADGMMDAVNRYRRNKDPCRLSVWLSWCRGEVPDVPVVCEDNPVSGSTLPHVVRHTRGHASS